MPVYEYKCPSCKNIVQIIKSVKDYDKIEVCSCGDNLIKIPSRISFGFVNQFKDVEQKAAEEGFVIHEPGLDKDAKRNREYKEEETRKRIRKSVEQTIMDHVI